MARRFRTIRGVRREVRETSWLRVGGSATTAIAAADTAVLAGGFLAATLALRPFTVVRTHIFMTVSSDQQAALEDFNVAYGHAVVSDQAFAIGVTAVPTPVADAGSDLWYLHQWLGGRLQFNTAAGFGDYSIHHHIDSKAMRKVEDGQDMAIVLETGSGSNGVRVFTAGRMLIKLH